MVIMLTEILYNKQ